MDPLQDELERSAFRYLDETINSFPSGAPSAEAPSSAPIVGGDGCDYTISATVTSFIDIRKLLMCRPSSECLVRINSHRFSPHTLYFATACDVAPADENIRCVLVLSTVNVSAPQTVEPSEDDLNDTVTAFLRDAINGEGFEGYFPPGCMTA